MFLGRLLRKRFRYCTFIKMAERNVSSMRIDYNLGGKLDTEELKVKEPISMFEIWFDEAKNTEGIGEANAMTLATSTRNGLPSARIVLLKGLDKNGFRFFTNFESRKGQELVRIEGPVEKLTDEESTEYFHSRPRGSQISACVSNQSSVIATRQVLIDKHKEWTEKFAECEKIPKPGYWGGYRVIPKYVEFWQGQSSRLHDRILFRRKTEPFLNKNDGTHAYWKQGDDGWMYATLSP